MSEKSKQSIIISSKIIRLREHAGWSQSELARRVGITRAALSLIEKGERIPSLVVAQKISYTLGITVEELMTEHSEKKMDDITFKIFWHKYRHINDLALEDQRKIEEFIILFKEASSLKESK